MSIPGLSKDYGYDASLIDNILKKEMLLINKYSPLNGKDSLLNMLPRLDVSVENGTALIGDVNYEGWKPMLDMAHHSILEARTISVVNGSRTWAIKTFGASVDASYEDIQRAEETKMAGYEGLYQSVEQKEGTRLSQFLVGLEKNAVDSIMPVSNGGLYSRSAVANGTNTAFTEGAPTNFAKVSSATVDPATQIADLFVWLTKTFPEYQPNTVLMSPNVAQAMVKSQGFASKWGSNVLFNGYSDKVVNLNIIEEIINRLISASLYGNVRCRIRIPNCQYNDPTTAVSNANMVDMSKDTIVVVRMPDSDGAVYTEEPGLNDTSLLIRNYTPQAAEYNRRMGVNPTLFNNNLMYSRIVQSSPTDPGVLRKGKQFITSHGIGPVAPNAGYHIAQAV